MTKPTTSRILACRGAFVLLCVLPTLATCSWLVREAVADRSALDPAFWQAAIGERLGLTVEIGQIARDGSAFRLEELRFLEPETGQLAARAAAADIEFRNDAWHVRLWQPQIADARLLRRSIEDRLLRSSGTLPRCYLASSELTVSAGGAKQSLTNLQCEVGTTEAIGPGLQIECECPGHSAQATHVRLLVTRNRQLTPPATGWSLECGPGSLPCALFVDLLPELAQLGSECQFQGSLALAETPSGLQGEFAGMLTGVDLDALVTERFPHQLSGRATVRIDETRLVAGKLMHARGSLYAERGAVSHSLVAAAAAHLGLDRLAEAPLEPGRSLPFSRLTLGFQMTETSLQLAGSAGSTRPGVVLDGPAGPVLVATGSQSLPPVNLLRALLPDSRYQVPATRQTSALASLLPVPDVVPTSIAARPAHTPTRLRTSGPPDAAPALRPPALR